MFEWGDRWWQEWVQSDDYLGQSLLCSCVTANTTVSPHSPFNVIDTSKNPIGPRQKWGGLGTFQWMCRFVSCLDVLMCVLFMSWWVTYWQIEHCLPIPRLVGGSKLPGARIPSRQSLLSEIYFEMKYWYQCFARLLQHPILIMMACL